jgi:hypothetical protein
MFFDKNEICIFLLINRVNMGKVNIIKFVIEYDSKICGNLTYIEDMDEKVGVINFISIEKEYRGKGMGTALLWNLYDYSISKGNVDHMLWDDCTDNFRKKHNIYTKIGATYMDKTGPEMTWKIHSKKVKNKRLKYDKSIYNIIML